jgi:hypothetical protein
MRWFRKEPRGRHALGAAVTSIPTGPLPPVVPGQARAAAAQPVPAAVVVPVQPLPPLPAPSPVPGPVAPAVAATPPAAPVTPLTATPQRPVTLPAVPVPVAAPPPAVDPLVAPLELLDVVPVAGPLLVEDAARHAPVARLEPVPTPAAAAPPPPSVDVPAPAGPRVELGFSDGSSRTLDPQSSAAQRLQALVGELTRPNETDGSATR